MLAEALLDAETKIGELLREIHRNSLRNEDGQWEGKEKSLPEGISWNQSSQFQKMAERRAGELLREQEKNPGAILLGGGTGAGGDTCSPPAIPKLSDIGISKKQYKARIGRSDTSKTKHQIFCETSIRRA